MQGVDPNTLQTISIGREHWDVPVRVELRPYMEFSLRITHQLQKLVERWQRPGLQSPSPLRRRRPR
jgi:hypothetical protein